jgi:hypothetical protein
MILLKKNKKIINFYIGKSKNLVTKFGKYKNALLWEVYVISGVLADKASNLTVSPTPQQDSSLPLGSPPM